MLPTDARHMQHCLTLAKQALAAGDVPVTAVAGVGRVLPAGLWDAMLRRLDDEGPEPWERTVELVPADLLTSVFGPSGAQTVDAGLWASTCPAAPELLRAAG